MADQIKHLLLIHFVFSIAIRAVYTVNDNVIFKYKSSSERLRRSPVADEFPDELEAMVIDENNKFIHLKWIKSSQTLANEHLPIWTAHFNEWGAYHIPRPNVFDDMIPFRAYHDLEQNSAIIYSKGLGGIWGVIDISYALNGVPIDLLHQCHRVGGDYVDFIETSSHDQAKRPRPARSDIERFQNCPQSGFSSLSTSSDSSRSSSTPEVTKREINSEDYNTTNSRKRREDEPEHFYVETLLFVSKEAITNYGVSNVVNHLDTIAMDHLIQFSFIDMIYAKMATHGVHIHINLAGIIIECQKGAFDVVTTYPLHGTESRMDELFGSRFPRYLMYYDLPFTRDSIDLIYVTTDRSFFAKHGNKAAEKRSVGLTWGRIDKYKTRQIYKDIPITPLTIVLSTNTFQAACIGAHEIGHALRITHDPSHVSRCQNQKQCYGIMQKAYPFCFNCLKWSEESLHQFHEFTQLDKDRCFLLNFPRSLYPPGPRRTLSPCQQCHCYGYNSYGEIPDQCSLQVPATGCSKHLQCEGSNEIKSPYEPTILPLDGTPCGQNKVCWDGSCVDIEENQITAL